MPWKPSDVSLPHPAYTGQTTTLKAIARSGNAGETYGITWDTNWDGDFDNDPTTIYPADAHGRIPTISLQPPRGGAAALLGLYPNPEEQGRLVGDVAVQILTRGPSALPSAPLAPKKIELEINLPLAKQLGVKVPMSLLDSATRVLK